MAIIKTDANTIVITDSDITAIGAICAGFATALKSGDISVPGFAEQFFNELVERGNSFNRISLGPL